MSTSTDSSYFDYPYYNRYYNSAYGYIPDKSKPVKEEKQIPKKEEVHIFDIKDLYL